MLGGTKDNVLPHEGSLIGPPFESVIFYKKQTKLHFWVDLILKADTRNFN